MSRNTAQVTNLIPLDGPVSFLLLCGAEARWKQNRLNGQMA